MSLNLLVGFPHIPREWPRSTLELAKIRGRSIARRADIRYMILLGGVISPNPTTAIYQISKRLKSPRRKKFCQLLREPPGKFPEKIFFWKILFEPLALILTMSILPSSQCGDFAHRVSVFHPSFFGEIFIEINKIEIKLVWRNSQFVFQQNPSRFSFRQRNHSRQHSPRTVLFLNGFWCRFFTSLITSLSIQGRRIIVEWRTVLARIPAGSDVIGRRPLCFLSLPTAGKRRDSLIGQSPSSFWLAYYFLFGYNHHKCNLDHSHAFSKFIWQKLGK